ncbi:hypothetical protein [Rhizobium sp. Leaf341]|uniref:hypothetical protein n=1 Tax=Rhizobium sp. Leaf341 TaxID=1736344 RepID=UPI00071265E6|nr:hypothetical protein [Rhizobium sp. Leaf341]KQR75762.1 hypothetical protein ASG03_19015 [Rhizobium sp. Leaf341]
MKELLMSQLLPQLFNFLIVGLLAVISMMARRWFGISIEGKHRDALQSALANGAKLLLLPGGTVDQAVEYVLHSVPDALKQFGKTSPDDIRQLLEPHILGLPKPPVLVLPAPATGGSPAEGSASREGALPSAGTRR